MTTETRRVKSPSRLVWRTQMDKGIHTPHRVSKITCSINQLLSNKLTEQLFSLGIKSVYVESGRNERLLIKKRPLGLPGTILSLQDGPVDVFRFTIPRDSSHWVVNELIDSLELHLPGRGTILAQDLIEFSNIEPPRIVLPDNITPDNVKPFNPFLTRNLSYITCVLTIPGSADKLAKVALELGICVPLITSGTGTDIRDKLGLIRITIPREKELVHLIMPEHDSHSVIQLLIEEAGLNRPGRGFIYQTPVSAGLIDSKIRIGKQEYAASIEQIIAAIDQIKADTSWRRRSYSNFDNTSNSKLVLPEDHCEVSVICIEDRVEMIVEAAIASGAGGAITSKVKRLIANDDDLGSAAQSHTTISVPAAIIDQVADNILEVGREGDNSNDRVQVLDSPEAYVQSW